MSRHKASRRAAPWRSNQSRRLSPQFSAGNARRGRRLLFEPLEVRRLLAITVTTVDDVVDANDGLISLREAIVAANAAPGADTIDFDPALTASAPAIIALQHGELAITETLTVDGPGSGVLTIDAQKDSRIFNITATTGDFALSGMTLVNGREAARGGAVRSTTSGRLSLKELIVEDNDVTFDGGGIFSAGLLSIDECIIRNNHSTASNGEGGGIYAAVGFEMRNSRVEGNSARGDGGGIFGGIGVEVLQISGSVIAGNSCVSDRFSRGYGGGLFVGLKPEFVGTVTNSVLQNNSAREGGGVHITGQAQFIESVISMNRASLGGGGVYGTSAHPILLIRCEVSENLAYTIGGGIRGSAVVVRESTFANNRSDGSGGAIYGANVEAYNSTFSGNTAAYDGGAFYAGAKVTISRSTVTDNEAGRRGGGIYTVTGSLQSSIVADNRATLGGQDLYRTQEPASGPFAAFSLIGHADGTLLTETGLASPDANGNLIGGSIAGAIDPQLSPLTYNGGFKLVGGVLLRTHALLPVSPALNAGDPTAIAGVADIPLHDQRGNPFSRVAGGRIDIGAYELHSSMLLQLVVDNLIDESDGDFSIGDLSLREAIELANASNFDGIVDTISFDPGVFSTPSTIQLVHGELVITDSLQIDPPVAGILTIDASGNDPTPGIDKGDGTNAFIIDDLNDASLIDVSFRGLSIKGGDATYGGGILTSENLTITDCRISENSSQTFGGGIFSIGGTLTISQSDIIDNHAQGEGGGIASLDGQLIVLKSTISGNTARSGGGVYTYGGPATIESSRIANNTASNSIGLGGGIHSVTGPLVVRKTQITGNSAHDAGGVYFGTSLEFVESMVSGNVAARDGGGIVGRGETKLLRSNIVDNAAGRHGGGLIGADDVEVDASTIARNSAADDGGGLWLDANNSDIKLLQATVSGNRSGGHGGGVWASNLDGEIDIAHSTIALNETTDDGFGGGIFLFRGQLALDHTIVATNYAEVGPDLSGLLGATIDARYSLIGDNLNSGLAEAPVGQADVKGNLIGGSIGGSIDPQLGALGYHGGPTPTHSLSFININLKSPAIDVGDPAATAGAGGFPEFDQRGTPYGRVFDLTIPGPAQIDIGAYELHRPDPVVGAIGNYNGNGTIDAADYVVWQDNLGKAVTPNTMGDGNGDGEVTWADYEVWKWNFARNLAAAGAASVEPATINIEIETRQAEEALAIAADELTPFTFEFSSNAPERDQASDTVRRLPFDRAVTSTDQLLAAWAAIESPRRTSLTDSAVDANEDTTRLESHLTDLAFASLGRPLPRLR